MLFLRRGGIILNRKKISRLIAGALATSVVLNSSPSAVESVHAITKDIYSEGTTLVGTRKMGQLVIERLSKV